MDNYDLNGFHLIINRLTFLKKVKGVWVNLFWQKDLQLIIPKKITEIGMYNIANL